MHKFIIDANLPGGVQPFMGDEFVHISEMDCRLPDAYIWDFARQNGYTIISKDADFYNRILLADPPPKVIHIRFGNIRLRHFIPLM